MSELERLTELCVQLGAERVPAETMARQLLKRAEQLSATRGWPREEALEYLLQLVVKGRHGEAPFPPLPPVITDMKESLIAKFNEIYGHAPAVVTRAPGRIEFIGNHTDYNGGTVLGAAIDRGVWVALRPTEDGTRRFYSATAPKVVTLPAALLEKQIGGRSWINYPLGVCATLAAFQLHAPGGFEFLALADLPAGAGLSSSAAIELASALAFLTVTRQDVPRETLVQIGRHAENHFVGVPCGILDQGVSGFGKKDHLVFIDCRGPSFATVPLPAGAHFWIFNTHTKHALVDGLYAARHRECMEAAQALGVALLADATPAQLEQERDRLTATAYRRARHVVEEIARVGQVKAALAQGDLAAVGRTLTASHQSSRMLFENSSPELDFLAERLAATPHVHGARLTGGGFGGAVMALTDAEFSEVPAGAVADAYARQFGAQPGVMHLQTAAGAQVVAADAAG